ncbi:hypothetical protein AMATHDRAFT_45116 [Amanita thiersii Skay4041]|uniref:F-box domain-containing protein n=1 Tax=Amanita thiersii Skay4041 TaxID=703135 RepID=A0A2A9P0S5_9AGAR|nr:hypothetical protein AMATHDRAFT_45116 [Amanita thiersii Skay4041]
MSSTPLYMPTSDYMPSIHRKHSARSFDHRPLMKTCIVDDSRYQPIYSAISISDLRDAIHSIDSQVATLLRKRHELDARLERAVRSQSPVHRLPSELLSSIFVTAVLGAGENFVMVSTLMLVCHHWAEIALSTPLLWAKITISQHHSLERAKLRLERSKSFPLDVVIDFRLDYTIGITEQVIHAMDLLRPAIWRIKSLRICVPNRQQAHAVLLRCQEDAPLLESLTISIQHSIQDERTASLLHLFKGQTPRLQSCSFMSFHFGWDINLLSRLHILRLDGYFNNFAPSPSTLVSILSQCPELEELSLRNISYADAVQCPVLTDDAGMFLTPHKSIHLLRLVKASFSYADISLIRHVMSQIAFPNLESLELCYLGNVTPLLNFVYNQALTRLPLRHLRIESCLFSELMFLKVLPRVPSLSTLELVDAEDVSSNVIRALSSPQPWICPRLVSLTLDGCTSFDWESLRTVIESRLPPNPNAYPRFHTSPAAIVSSASASAAALARSKVFASRTCHPTVGPQRLRAVDVTRCNQISREMIQWLRMYVADVKCEPARAVWDDSLFA